MNTNHKPNTQGTTRLQQDLHGSAAVPGIETYLGPATQASAPGNTMQDAVREGGPGEACAGSAGAGGHIPAPAANANPVKSSDESLVEAWAQRIRDAYLYSVQWIILTGCELIEAKKQLAHGSWMLLFARKKVKFGLRTAEMLMAIARQPLLNRWSELGDLPSAFTTLYTLSKLSPAVLQEKMAAGAITPETTLAQARRWVAETRITQQLKTASPAFNLPRQRERLVGYLHRQGKMWPPACRTELAAVLEKMAGELRAMGNQTQEVKQ